MEPKQEEHDLPVPGELSLFSGMTLMGTFSDTPDNAGVGKNAQESEGVSGSLSTEFQEVFAGLTVLQTKTGSSTEDSTFPPRTLEKTPTSTNDAKPHLAQDSETLSTAVHSCTTRKKKRSQAKRPGYAREADSQNVPSITTSNQKESLTEPSTRENTEEDNSSSRLYSIGTPSSSEDELVKPDEQDIPYQGPEDVEADNKQFDKSIISKTNEEGTLDIGACPELTANLENNVIKKGEIIGDASKEGTFVENKDATSDVSCNDDSDDLHHVDETNNEDNIHGYDNRHNTSFVYYDEPSDEDVTESLRVEDHEKYSKKSLASYEIDLSPDELFAIHEEGVQHKISSIREKMTVIEDMESQLVTLYSNSECVLDKYRKELQDLHNKEIDALANDNYDLAEEISSKIEGLESLIESTKYQLPFTDDKVQDALSLRREVTSHAISVHQDVLESMHTLHDEQAKILSVRRHDSSTKLLQEKQRLNSERNRIQRALGHVELDKGHLSTEQQQIRDDIRQRTEGFTARRDELVQQRDDVKEQIAELERQLDVLRSQEMRFTQEIKEEEERIETIVAEFSPQLTLLQDQQCHLEIQRIQLETDKESLAREEESFDVSSKEWQRENQRFEDLLSDVNGSITKTEQTIKDLEGWQKEVELFMKCKHLTFPVNSELDSLRKSSKKLALQIKSLKTRLHLSEKTATSLRKRVNEIEELVSARDEAKEIAKKGLIFFFSLIYIP
ncbi:predicted protein [Nematostella vectensis]|uniref:Uncharacterized protein n=1 Tax=Nematostella vectensis TaxID=45351 RepID=A7RXG7_NEMVE|nr:predicted protein [Nematostella vectensis]|eukprot:XP_001635835.1 predicted protein [Nematostella vectensis]